MQVPIFNSRAEAFDYMFVNLCSQGEEMMEAASKAEKFAEIVAKNRALPDKPKNIVGQCVDMVKQVSEIKREYPEMWDVVSGLLGGVVGVLAGTKAVESSSDDEPIEILDFDNME